MSLPIIQWHRRIGRLQLSLTVFRHTYFRSSDRWVIQPVLIYDRKRAALTGEDE